MILLREDFAVDPDQVAALEHYDHWRCGPSPSDSSIYDHSGTIVILKNGRKTYLKGITVKEVQEKLGAT